VIESCNNYGGDGHNLGIFFLYAVTTHKLTNNSYPVEMPSNGSLCNTEVDTATDHSIMSRLNIEKLPLRCVVICSVASCTKS